MASILRNLFVNFIIPSSIHVFLTLISRNIERIQGTLSCLGSKISKPFHILIRSLGFGISFSDSEYLKNRPWRHSFGYSLVSTKELSGVSNRV